MSFGCQLSCLTPANKVCSFVHKDLFLALCNTRASTEENSQFQYSEAAARQWGWEPALINAELIYNLMLLCFKVRYQKRTTQGQAWNSSCQHWKTKRRSRRHCTWATQYWEGVAVERAWQQRGNGKKTGQRAEREGQGSDVQRNTKGGLDL